MFPSLGGVPTPLRNVPAPRHGPAPAYCLCVRHGGRWKRVVTVADGDQLRAFDQAIRALPPGSSDPITFQASDLCPPAEDDHRNPGHGSKAD